MTAETVETKKIEVAQRVGINPTQIRSVKFELDTLKKQGLLVDLSISGTSMFTRSTSWVELGIQEMDDVRVSRFTKGQKHLIPDSIVKKLKSVETSMRQLLDKLSYSVTGFSPYRWLPYTAYDEWRDKFSELQGRLDDVKWEILKDYDYYRNLIKEDFEQIANASFRSLERQGYDWAIINHKAYDREGFIEMVVADAMSKFPSREKVETELRADYITALVFTDEDIEAEKLKAEKLRAEATIEKERAEKVKFQQQLEIERENEKFRHEREVNRLAEEEKEAKLHAMWKAELEHAREQLDQIVSPFQEVFLTMRKQMAEDAESMLASIKKNGFVRGKIAEKGRGLIDFFELMTIPTTSDNELKSKLIELRSAIGENAKDRADDTPERSTSEIIGILEEIKELSHKASQAMNTVNRFSMVE